MREIVKIYVKMTLRRIIVNFSPCKSFKQLIPHRSIESTLNKLSFDGIMTIRSKIEVDI